MMNSSEHLTHLPPLGGHVRDEIGRTLQDSLVELVDLSLIGKQLHWSVTGPLFRSLHLQLDEMIDAWRDLADTVAERAVAIGTYPDGQAAAVVAGSPLPPVERGAIPEVGVVYALARLVAETAERMRTRLDRLGDLDLVSQDVLLDIVRILEHQLWMIRVQLPAVRS